MSQIANIIGGSVMIHPVEYNLANSLGYAEGAIVELITNWKDNGGIEDLRSVERLVRELIDLEMGEDDRR